MFLATSPGEGESIAATVLSLLRDIEARDNFAFESRRGVLLAKSMHDPNRNGFVGRARPTKPFLFGSCIDFARSKV